jgi:ATP-dependent RNA helicase RhlE
MPFKLLDIIEPVLRALKTEGYAKPTPIQEQAIPVLLQRKDLLGLAQTGTGKTAAFAIPILQTLYNERTGHTDRHPIRALILTPTRELALQTGESFKAYGRHTGLRHTVIYGGVSQRPQTDALKAGVDILIATPGRLLDLMHQRFVDLRHVHLFVLDEADRMLDMGFIHDVKKIVAKLPVKRQTMMFSATMPPEIAQLASELLHHPVRVEVTPAASTVESIEQAVYMVEKMDKPSLLVHLLKDPAVRSALVFTRTKYGAERVLRHLVRSGVQADAIHGDKSQGARQRALGNFKARRTRVLVATDIAARGIDVEEISHVINYELPHEPETYVHRIGRTGRAGLSGVAWSFCEYEERKYLRAIRHLIGRDIRVIEEHPHPSVWGQEVPKADVRSFRPRGRGGFRRRR